MKTKMLVYCAWCGEYIRTIDGKGQTGASHGMCPECYGKEMTEVENPRIAENMKDYWKHAGVAD